jgi:hypothetical protein
VFGGITFCYCSTRKTRLRDEVLRQATPRLYCRRMKRQQNPDCGLLLVLPRTKGFRFQVWKSLQPQLPPVVNQYAVSPLPVKWFFPAGGTCGAPPGIADGHLSCATAPPGCERPRRGGVKGGKGANTRCSGNAGRGSSRLFNNLARQKRTIILHYSPMQSSKSAPREKATNFATQRTRPAPELGAAADGHCRSGRGDRGRVGCPVSRPR